MSFSHVPSNFFFLIVFILNELHIPHLEGPYKCDIASEYNVNKNLKKQCSLD